MSNSDLKAISYRDRLIAVEEEIRVQKSMLKDLSTEIKSAGFSRVERAGIKLAVKRHFESEEKRDFRAAVEEVYESLGEFRNTPLGAAAVERHTQGHA